MAAGWGLGYAAGTSAWLFRREAREAEDVAVPLTGLDAGVAAEGPPPRASSVVTPGVGFLKAEIYGVRPAAAYSPHSVMSFAVALQPVEVRLIRLQEARRPTCSGVAISARAL